MVEITKYKFTNEQLKELLDAQESLNEKYTGKDWRDAIPLSSLLTALDTEVAEYLESSPRVGDNERIKNNGWAWWKQSKTKKYWQFEELLEYFEVSVVEKPSPTTVNQDNVSEIMTGFVDKSEEQQYSILLGLKVYFK